MLIEERALKLPGVRERIETETDRGPGEVMGQSSIFKPVTQLEADGKLQGKLSCHQRGWAPGQAVPRSRGEE